MRHLWLIFAQSTTIVLAVLFVVSTLRPEWVPQHLLSGGRSASITVLEAPARAPADGAAGQGLAAGFADAAALAAPAVVNVFTSGRTSTQRHPLADDPVFRRFFGDSVPSPQRRGASSLGSGVIVSPQGYILTNNHVVAAAREIEVALADGRMARAELVGADPESDLAVLKIDLPDLPVMTLGQDQNLRVGDVVLAIGNPFGVGQTTTMGIVSALGRTQLGINTFENFIQTDAAINPGNSGGALIDSQGHLVGINTAIYSRSGGSLGIGFAIPVATARDVLEQLITVGSVTRGYIGVEPQDLTAEVARALRIERSEGVLIASVLPQGPAARAGVRPGDVVYTIGEQPVLDTASLLNTVAALPPGSRVQVQLVRDGRELTVELEVGVRPAPRPAAQR